MEDKVTRERYNQAERSEPIPQPPKRRRGHPMTDITGQRFRMLTALYPTEKRDRHSTVIWHCRCDCGREVDISYEDLKYSQLISCGCRKKEAERHLNSYLTQVTGTSVDLLKSDKLRVNNKTGVRGVYMVHGRYKAEIRFQGTCYRLGTYKELRDAAAARQHAEQQLHGAFLEYYEQWKTKADSDPIWGASHPVEVQVVRKDGNDFELILRPELGE